MASRQLYHERRAVGQGSEFASGSGHEGGHTTPVDYAELAEKTGQADSERVHEMAGRVLVHRAVAEQLIDHVYRNVRDGVLPPAAGTLIRLFHSETVSLDMDAALAIAGAAGVVGEHGEGLQTGLRYLSRQNVAIGGGTTEMARNVIGERVLNFPTGIRRRSRGPVQSGAARPGRLNPLLLFGEDVIGLAGGLAADKRHLDQRQDVVRRASGRSHQHTVAALPARAVAGGGQRADARRPEVGDGAEIDRQRCYAGTAFDGDLAVQGGCGGGIDITADDDAAGQFSPRPARRIRSRLPVGRLSG